MKKFLAVVIIVVMAMNWGLSAEAQTEIISIVVNSPRDLIDLRCDAQISGISGDYTMIEIDVEMTDGFWSTEEKVLPWPSGHIESRGQSSGNMEIKFFYTAILMFDNTSIVVGCNSSYASTESWAYASGTYLNSDKASPIKYPVSYFPFQTGLTNLDNALNVQLEEMVGKVDTPEGHDYWFVWLDEYVQPVCFWMHCSSDWGYQGLELQIEYR